MSVDPLADKHPELSPYTYVNNNPVKYIDPDGKDFILLIDKQGAGGNGHMAMLLQDGNGAWYYFSQGAEGNPGRSGMIAGSNTRGGVTLMKLEITESKVMKDANGVTLLDTNGNPRTQQVTRGASKQEALSGALSGQLGTDYDDSFEFSTTDKEDRKIHNAATKIKSDFKKGKSKYNLYFNNCVDACQDAIQDKTKIDMPTDFSAVPNSYFEKVQKDGIDRN